MIEPDVFMEMSGLSAEEVDRIVEVAEDQWPRRRSRPLPKNGGRDASKNSFARKPEEAGIAEPAGTGAADASPAEGGGESAPEGGVPEAATEQQATPEAADASGESETGRRARRDARNESEEAASVEVSSTEAEAESGAVPTRR